MPLILRGRSKARLEIQWDGSLPVTITIVAQAHPEVDLYQTKLTEGDKVQVELNQLEFAKLGYIYEPKIIAVIKSEIDPDIVSKPLTVQKCRHANCGQWGHAREDGYCKHCGRRIKNQAYTLGFPKLSKNKCNIVLWDGVDGRLTKKKEAREQSGIIYSLGKYEDKNHQRGSVEILEEKYDEESSQRFIKLHHLLKKTKLLGKQWKLPLASFQEKDQRMLWIYPRLVPQSDWRTISALGYIFAEDVKRLSTRDIINIGIQLCYIAETIHEEGYLWASLKLSDLVLCRKRDKTVSVYLRSRDIAWDKMPDRSLFDMCLIPWELFWEETLAEGYGITEVYIIAAVLYFLKAKSPNLLSYNSISYPYGLPSLKLFAESLANPQRESRLNYFEAIINRALLIHPNERGYKNVRELRCTLETLLAEATLPGAKDNYTLDVGTALDVGNSKREDDLSKNQDAVFITSFTLETQGWGLFVLCDGISTAHIGSGDVASRIVVETFQEWWADHSDKRRMAVCQLARQDYKKACRFLSDMINQANWKIRMEAEDIAPAQVLRTSVIMGTTVTAGLIYEGVMVFGWLGDSPIYRISNFGWERLNYEDNERNYRIKKGLPLQDCLTDGGNSLTRCVGGHLYDNADLDMHFNSTPLYQSECLLVCSDGIPDYIEQETAYAHHENYQMLRIASVLHNYQHDAIIDSQALASILTSTVNTVGGGCDNLSAIVIRVLAKNSNNWHQSYQRLRVLTANMQNTALQNDMETQKILTMNQIASADKKISE